MLDFLHALLPAHFHIWYIPLLFFAGLIGEGYGALVGGGSFVTQPALLLTGLPLQSVLAIDAAAPLGTELGIMSETYRQIIRHKKLVLLLMVPITLGGVVGAWLLLTVSPNVIKYIMVVSIMTVLTYSHFEKKKPDPRHLDEANYVLLVLSMFVISIYTIFIGLGEGTFGRLAMMATIGLTFVQSSGLGAGATLPARMVALGITATGGLIVWPYLVTMWCSNFIAGKYAIKFVKRIPDKYMKSVLMIISLGFVAYLLFFY